MPHRLKRFARDFGVDKPLRILDIGCGNHSATRTKRWLPKSRYYGLDIQNYNNDDADFDAMEQFYRVDLSGDLSQLGLVPDNSFDAIVMAHVIEHLPNGLEVVSVLTKKLCHGGRIYIEFPGQRSLGLPSVRGTLNFCDDPTHVHVYQVAEIANLLLANNCKILSAGTRRDWPRLVLTPLNFLYQWFRDGSPSAVTLWDISGFAEYVYAERRNDETAS